MAKLAVLLAVAGGALAVDPAETVRAVGVVLTLAAGFMAMRADR